MEMKCPVCEKGVLKKQKVSVDKFGVFVGVFEAEVCGACGEQIFGSKEAEKVEQQIQKLQLTRG